MYLTMDEVSATALFGGGVKQDLVSYYRQQRELTGNVGMNPLFQDTLAKWSNDWLSEESLQRQRIALQSVNYIVAADMVRELNTIDELQMAKPVMRSYIMSNPRLFDMYVRDKISGYDGQFEQSQTGELNPYWQGTMNGVAVETETNFEFTTYDTDETFDLTFDEQEAVLNTWARVESLIEIGEDDPTDVLGNSL